LPTKYDAPGILCVDVEERRERTRAIWLLETSGGDHIAAGDSNHQTTAKFQRHITIQQREFIRVKLRAEFANERIVVVGLT
jgi:hypothetical protein